MCEGWRLWIEIKIYGTGAKMYINGEMVKELATLGGFPLLNPKCGFGFKIWIYYLPEEHNEIE